MKNWICGLVIDLISLSLRDILITKIRQPKTKSIWNTVCISSKGHQILNYGFKNTPMPCQLNAPVVKIVTDFGLGLLWESNSTAWDFKAKNRPILLAPLFYKSTILRYLGNKVTDEVYTHIAHITITYDGYYYQSELIFCSTCLRVV